MGDMVLSILGTRLLLSIYGLHTYAVPALGGAYLNGQQDAIEPDNIIFGNPSASILYAAFLIYSAASSSLASPSGVPKHYPDGWGFS